MATTTPEKIESPAEFQPTPEDQYRLWMVEIQAAKDNLVDWKKKAQGAIDRFLDKRSAGTSERHLNLFTSNVQTLRAMLYGKVPNVDVSRRFGDAKDDAARVSAELIERCLNTDIERDGDGFKDAIGSALDDRLLGGLGQVRLRYVVETEEREVPPKMGPAPMPMDMSATMDPAMLAMAQSMAPQVVLAEGYTETVKVNEDVETDYTHWDDFLWSPCRTWAECRWVAFGVQMTREDLVGRFGETIGKVVPLDAPATSYGDAAKEQKIDDVWGRAYVWEVWDKTTRKVLWLCESHHAILDTKEDPLGLAGFFPCPRPLLANVTTTALLPTPDYFFAQDQYRELDEVTTRISTLQEAIAVKGVGDTNSTGLKALVSGGANEIVQIPNFALFRESGGVKGAVDWFPLDMVIGALRELEAYRDRLIQQLFQITGLSDIVRGQASGTGATATEQSIKAKFASVRLQALQDETSRFASDVQRIRAEIVSRHFDDETIVERANFVGGQDQELIGPALQLLREKFAGYRIEIKPENINLSDTAAMKSERTEVLGALGQFMAQTVPLRQADPKSAEMLVEVMGWVLASLKGSNQIEGVFDRYRADVAEAAKQPRPPPGPPPQVVIEGMKQKGAMQQTQADLQADLMRTRADAQAEIAKQRSQLEADLVTKRADEDAAMRAEQRTQAAKAIDAFTGGGM